MTVTLLNDACVLALGHTVMAELHVNAAGALVDFVSDDRLHASPGGAIYLWGFELQAIDFAPSAGRTG